MTPPAPISMTTFERWTRLSTPALLTPTITGTPAGNPLDEILRRRPRTSVSSKFVGFAHHAEDGDAAHSLGDVELDERVDARPIDIALIGEGCHRDNVNAAGIGADLRHKLTTRC